MLSTMWRFIYTKYWGILMLNTVGRFIYTKYWGILYVEHCGKIYLHKILRNTVCWAPWDDLFTQNTEEYFMLNTVRRFVYTKYWGILLCWALCEDLFTQNTEEYFVEHCGKIYLHKILIILYVKHCDKIYLHKLLRNTVCWALWEDFFTQNTGDYFMLNTVGRFIYTKYWGILYVEHCGKIYLHKIQRNNVCFSTVGKSFT